jgi:integrase
MISLGEYPAVSLRDARDKALELRRQISKGIDPSAERRRVRQSHELTFFAAVEKYIERRKQEVSQTSVERDTWVLKKKCIRLHNQPLAGITTRDLLDLLHAIEAEGLGDTPRRTKIVLNTFYEWAIDTHLVEQNPVSGIRKRALKKHKPQNFAHVTTPQEIGELCRVVDSLDTLAGVALQVALRTACRPGEVRMMRRADLDLDQATWTLPNTKSGRRFVIPLPKAVVKILLAYAPEWSHPEYLFANLGTKNPITDAAMPKALREAGYRGKCHPHGFRHVFATAVRDHLSFDNNVIERQLNHVPGNGGVQAVYDHSGMIAQRRRLLEAWCRLLEKWKAEAVREAA